MVVYGAMHEITVYKQNRMVQDPSLSNENEAEEVITMRIYVRCCGSLLFVGASWLCDCKLAELRPKSVW